MKLMLRLTALVLVLALGLFPPLSAGAADTTVTLPDSWNGQWQDGPNGEPLYLEGYGYLSTLSSISNVLTAGETGQVYCKPGAVLPALLPALSLSEDVIFYGNGATINGPLYVEFDSSITFQQLIFDTGLSAGATAQATLHLLDCAFSGSWENAAFQLTGGACFLDRCTFQLGGGMPVQLTELAGASQLKDCVFAAWPQGPAIVATLDGCPKLSVNRSRFYVDTESYAPDTELLSVTGTASDTVIDVSRNYWSGFPPTEFSHNGHPVVYTPDFAGDPETQLIRFPFYRTEAMDTEVTYEWEEGDGPVTEIIRYPDGMIHTSIVYPSAAVDETATTTSSSSEIDGLD